MKKYVSIFLLCAASACAQSTADRVVGALADRSLAEQVSGMRTDDRIAMYSLMAKTIPENLHYQVLLAGAYVQKTRETTDYSYLDRATSVLDGVLSADSSNYEALRLLTETQLERHLFAKAAESSHRLIQIDASDPWNWGTLGDSYIEMGDYEPAAEAYQKMVSLRPDLASYNRAAHYRFLFNDVPGAIAIMKKAIQAGSSSPENVAWCLVDLGKIYLKTGQTALAQQSFTDALRTFKNYHTAYGGLGQVLAQTGDLRGAIVAYRTAQEITPLPDYAAALYLLYKKTGQDAEAAKQIELLDVIDKVSRSAGRKRTAIWCLLLQILISGPAGRSNSRKVSSNFAATSTATTRSPGRFTRIIVMRKRSNIWIRRSRSRLRSRCSKRMPTPFRKLC